MPFQVTPKAIHLSISDGTSSSTATASVALLGATVYSYISADVERLFVSSKSSIEGPAAVRGGIPICWFAPSPASNPQCRADANGHTGQYLVLRLWERRSLRS